MTSDEVIQFRKEAYRWARHKLPRGHDEDFAQYAALRFLEDGSYSLKRLRADYMREWNGRVGTKRQGYRYFSYEKWTDPRRAQEPCRAAFEEWRLGLLLPDWVRWMMEKGKTNG